MLKNKLTLAILGAMGMASVAFAAPKQMVTHNHTDVESNAYIDGVIGSQFPTKPYSDNKVFWASVKLACYGHINPQHECHSLVRMATNSDNPVDLGWMTVNLVTGELNPKILRNNGYRLEVNGPGEVTLNLE